MNSSINSNSHLRPRKYGPPLQHSLPARQCLSTTAPQDHPIWTPFSNSSCFKFKGGWVGIIVSWLQRAAALNASWSGLSPQLSIPIFPTTNLVCSQTPPPIPSFASRSPRKSLHFLFASLSRKYAFPLRPLRKSNNISALQPLFRTGTSPGFPHEGRSFTSDKFHFRNKCTKHLPCTNPNF